ncbi:cupin domain-containing protein [Vibrio vulnificus]|uniref:cupin domain-containing protein n=1 Tax=Vibrio vulnificus TaxID=672 RepID=UPI00102A9862|nr:cupin domain-containing protein [Vibrio vulnificus]RZP73068.1 cupin domain-containing protein [Vibrio vulnificus]
MKAQAENINNSNRSFVTYSFESNEFEHPYHFHHETEIVFIKEGEGDVLIGNSSSCYAAGDIFLIGSNIPHRFLAYSENHYLRSEILQFSNECFGDLFFDAPELARINKLINQSKYGLIIKDAPQHLFESIDRLIHSDGINSVINFLRLLSDFDNQHAIEVISTTPEQYADIKVEARISAAVEWIESNFSHQIMLDLTR